MVRERTGRVGTTRFGPSLNLVRRPCGGLSPKTRPYRNEFKLSGTQPFSLPAVGDMQFGASLQAYPGGLGTWGGMQEGLYVHRTSTNELYTTYPQDLYRQPGHCVAPCVLGQRFIPEDIPTIERSTGGEWHPMVPLSSVKFLPYWTQIDVNVQ